MHPRVITLAAVYWIALGTSSVCVPKLASPQSDADAGSVAGSNAGIDQTIVTHDGQPTIAVTPYQDVTTPIIAATLTALLVIVLALLAVTIIRRIRTNGRPPLPLLALLATTAALTGCWAPKGPRTTFRINPWTRSINFFDSKDNHVVVEGLAFNAATGDGQLDRLEIDNSASAVIAQQVQQMQMWNEQMKTANDGIRQTLAGLATIVDNLATALPAAGASNPQPAPATPAAGTPQPTTQPTGGT